MKKGVFLLCGIFLSGCFYSRTHLEDKLSEPVCLEESSCRALATEDFIQGEWIDKSWWKMFDDAQLDTLIGKGLENSPTLKKADAQVEIAMQQSKEVRSLLIPQASAEGETNWQYLSPHGFFRSFAPVLPSVVNVIDLQINFNWELDFWGKNTKRFQAAIGKVNTQKAKKAETILELTISIAKSYFELQQAYAQKGILNELITEKEHYLDLITKIRTHGLATDLAVLTASYDLKKTQKALVEMEQNIVIRTHHIKALIGEGPNSETEITPYLAVFSKQFPLPENLSFKLITRRPDLVAQMWVIESAAKEIGVAKADFLPTFNLMGFGGLESISFASFFSLNNKNGALNPIITLPLFTGGRLTAALKAKKAEFAKDVYAYNDLLLIAAKQVADELSNFHLISEHLKIEDSSVLTLERKNALSNSRFNQGITNYLSVLDEKEALLAEKLTQTELAFRRNISALKLIKALGGGYESTYNRKDLKP